MKRLLLTGIACIALAVPALAEVRDDLVTPNMTMPQVERILGSRQHAVMISKRCTQDEPPYETVVCGVVWYVPFPPNEMLVIPFRLENSEWLVNWSRVSRGGPAKAIP
jgi:hypothetical protein